MIAEFRRQAEETVTPTFVYHESYTGPTPNFPNRIFESIGNNTIYNNCFNLKSKGVEIRIQLVKIFLWESFRFLIRDYLDWLYALYHEKILKIIQYNINSRIINKFRSIIYRVFIFEGRYKIDNVY